MQISLTVKPGTSQQKIIQNPDGSYVVYLRARAHDGEANAALIKLLSKHFKVSKSSIKILRGHTSHYKVIDLP